MDDSPMNLGTCNPPTPKEELKAAKEKYEEMKKEYRFHFAEAKRISKEKEAFRVTIKGIADKNREAKKAKTKEAIA